MADSDSDSSWNDVIRDWTLVNKFGEVEADDRAELADEEDETGLLASAPLHAHEQLSSVPSDEFQLSSAADIGAAAAGTADVGCETIARLEPVPDETDAAVVEDTGVEVSKACELDQRHRDTAEDTSVKSEEMQRSSHDAESSSSGSSIELLDISDEGLDQSAVGTPAEEEKSDSQKSVEVLNVWCGVDEKERSTGGSEEEELARTSEVVMSASGDHSCGATGSESLTKDRGEVENASAVNELSEVMVTETARSDEPSQHDVEVQQSTVVSSSTDRTDGSMSCDSCLDPAPRLDVEADAELLTHADSVADGFDELAAEAAAAADNANSDNAGDVELARAESEESIDTEHDMSIVSSVHSSDDIDMLSDAAQLADGIQDAVEAEAEHVDDRCESDISGVATDDLSSDLSSLSVGADIAMETGSMVYYHQPNPVFNMLLTCCAVLVVCFVLGIGVGHYFGSSSMPSLCDQQLHRLRSLQDEQYLCLSRLQQYEDKLHTISDDEHKLSAVTAVWVRKYEELVKERARLEQSLNVSQQVNEKSIEMAADYQRKLNESQVAVQFLAREVDRVTRELASANESRHSSELTSAEWKSKYQTMLVELEELEKELTSTRAEADEAEHALDVLQRDFARLTEERKSSYVVAEALHGEVAALKNTVNQQKLEKTELESIILSQRYSEHPGNVVTPSEHAVNSYNTETGATEMIYNHDKDKISPSQATLNKLVDDPGYDLSMEFVRLQKLLGRVAVELDEQKESETGSRAGGGFVTYDKPNTVFVSMLKFLMMSGQQSASLDVPSQMRSYGRALQHVTDCIELLDNLTLHRQLAKTLTSSWNEVLMLPVEGSQSSQEVKAFKMCQQQFASSIITNSKGDTGADTSVVDDMLRQYMNRTLEIVAQLSQTVQTTLDHVKTLPEELFAENKTSKKVGRKLTEAVNKLKSKVQSGWKKVASKFEDVRKKWFGYSEPKKVCKEKKKTEEEQMKRSKTNKKNGGDKFEGKPFTKSEEKVEDKKRSYKQTKSAPTGKESGEYGPAQRRSMDEFLHSSQLDDFFEDNHRAWRQHNNRRLQKVGGRIERLNDDMFLSMDDDDVEDIYEDLKDVKEDVEKRNQMDELWSWTSCQLRWWKTRIHRKHRAENLVKGCGRQLMHWQLRVLCRQMRKEKLPCSRLCDAVMQPPRPGRRSKHNKPFMSQNTKKAAEEEDWREMVAHDNTTDTNWYLRRVQDREDRHGPSPQWYLDWVDQRRYSRADADTNWYMRAMQHNTAVYPLSDGGQPPQQQHSSDGAAMKGHCGPN